MVGEVGSPENRGGESGERRTGGEGAGGESATLLLKE